MFPELSDYKILSDSKKIAYKHWIKWNKQVDKDELESQLLLWVALHFDFLKKLHIEKGPAVYMKYMNVSSKRLLDRFSQDEMIFKNKTVSVDFMGSMMLNYASHDEFAVTKTKTKNSLTAKSNYSLYSVEHVISRLKNKDPEFMLMAKNSCTPKQLEAIERIYYNGEEVIPVSESLNKTKDAIYYLLSRGVKNIVTKNYS